jgi:hypothetical protein
MLVSRIIQGKAQVVLIRNRRGLKLPVYLFGNPLVYRTGRAAKGDAKQQDSGFKVI